jgi:predicted nucleic acid-binding Zn ribbon protein
MNDEISCPVCGRPARLDAQPACDRCGSDLSDYRTIIRKSRLLLQQAALLLEQDAPSALRLAEDSLRLHATDDARRMVMVTQLCCRQYDAALAGWRQYRQKPAPRMTLAQLSAR